MGVYSNERMCHKLVALDKINHEIEKQNSESFTRRVKVKAKFIAFLSDKDFDNMTGKISKSDENVGRAVFEKKKYPIEQNTKTVISRMGVFEEDGLILFADISYIESERLKEGNDYILYGKFDFIEQRITIIFCNVMTDINGYDEEIFSLVKTLLINEGHISY